MRMELRRAIKLALIGHINTSIKKSEVIKQNSIHLLFLDIFVAIIDGVKFFRSLNPSIGVMSGAHYRTLLMFFMLKKIDDN